jgi:hypothetical protein
MGFEDELENFTLQLTNPSKQADLLMIDVWKEKVLLYKDLVAEIPKSIQATSATWAKKHIFGFSDEEIKLDVQQIRMERAVSAELDNTATIITHTGLFDQVDKLYGTVTGSTEAPPAESGGGGLGDLGAPPAGGGAPPPPPPAPEGGGEPPIPENFVNKNLKILTESKEEEIWDFTKGSQSFGDIDDQLSKLLGD